MNRHFKIDFWLLTPVFVLILISLTTLASINPIYLHNQIISLAIASFIFIILIQIDAKTYINLGKPIYFISIIALLIILIIGIESRGAVRWIEAFGMRFQLSEILKPFLSIALASHIAVSKHYSFKKYLRLYILLLPVVLFIYYQPDLGNALIYVCVFILTLLVIGYPVRWLGYIMLPLILTMPFLWNFLHEYQRQRLLTFIYPSHDPLGSSYNSIQAVIAIGSGMFIGKGLGEGTQSVLRFLPERQTDFIFAALSEDMGFIGALIIIIAFTVLLYRIYHIYINSEGHYEKTFLVCAFFFIGLQYVINIGMNLKLLPIVGITLPFISFGGSSLVANAIFLAIITSISNSSQKRFVLEIK